MALNTDTVLRLLTHVRLLMFHFAEGRFLYQRIGLILLMVQLSLFAFGMPPFHIGIWLQTEPDMVAMYSLGTCNALWLLYGVLRGRLVKQRATPLFYVLLAWVLWQIVPVFFAFTPYRAWFGPVEMGEGTAWHLCMLMVAMVGIPLWQVRSLRNTLLIWAACVISLESMLHVLFSARDNHYVPGVWVPAQWGAYLAFMVGYFWVMVMAGNYVRTPAVWMAIIAFTADVEIISYNKTAIALLPLVLLTSFGMYLRQKKKGAEATLPGKRVRHVMVALCFVPLAWILFSATYNPPETTSASNEKLKLLNLSHKDSALGSRVGLIQIGVRTMEYEPKRWLVGDGWGSFNDSMFLYALLPGVHMFEDGERRPNWGFVDGNAYHSHCQPLEALLALGIPGLILWFAIPVVILLTLPARLVWSCGPMLLLMNTTSFLWFQLPQCVPMQGLMMAALCSVCGEGGERRRWRLLPVGGLFMAVVALGVSTIEQYDGMMYGERVFNGSRYLDLEHYPREMLAMDFFRGADRLRTSAMGFALSLDKEHGDIDERQHAWYRRFMEMGHAMMVSPYIGPRGHYLELWLQYKLLLNLGFPVFSDLGREATSQMRDAVVTMAKVAPLRDDLAAFYFLNLDDLTHQNTAEQEDMLREVLSVVPEHRPALWLLGHILFKNPETKAEGEAMIRKAVALRVQDVYAVTPDQLAAWTPKPAN